MQKRRRTFATCSPITGGSARNSAGALALLVAAFSVCAPANAQTAPALTDVLARRSAIVQKLHAHSPSTLHVSGELVGAGLVGSFDSWVAGEAERDVQVMGSRTEITLRQRDGRVFAVDDNGNVRELRGLMLRRARTQAFIDNDTFTSQPQYDTFDGVKTLTDGRTVYAIRVSPPDGLPEEVDLDARTLMIDRLAYEETDGIVTSDFYDYRMLPGIALAQREVDSNGDTAFDMTRIVERIAVDRPMPANIFAVPKNTEIETDVPVTVPLRERSGHYYTDVTIHGKRYEFLVDTGAQGIVLDAHVAHDLGLQVEGQLEVFGTRRSSGLGIAALDEVRIGSAVLPLRSVSVLDLRNIGGAFQPDGVLGYPFFASAEVQIDAAHDTMTFARPGALHVRGEPLAIDVDRELIELTGKVNGVDGRFVVDTGNSAELLLYAPFMKAHPNLLTADVRTFANSFGVGGATQAQLAYVDELDVGTFRFFNRYSNLMLAERGAFADRFDAGNIGMGVLRNLIVTFDVADASAYAAQSTVFDDGRFRPRRESTIPP